MLPKVVISPVLPWDMYSDLLDNTGDHPDHNVNLGDINMYVSEVPDKFKKEIMDELEFELGRSLSLITMFTRYNSSELDSSFRIHSDGKILGEQPDVAFVYYLWGTSGTALFSHPKHGEKSDIGEVFTEDDGEWVMSLYNPPSTNSMLIYDASSFHSRWPPKEEHKRAVIVGFLKYKEFSIG